MKRILFVIHNMEEGGAQRVLLNLVNHMDPSKFDISVVALFGGGVNETSFAPHIRYRSVFKKPFRGNRIIFKLFSPSRLFRFVVREHYDIVVSYLEGITARIVSGCMDKDTKIVSWIHGEQHTMKYLAGSFRSPKEAHKCYHRFHNTVMVAEGVRDDFSRILDFKGPHTILYNTIESDKILKESLEPTEINTRKANVNLVAVGMLRPVKGYDRILRIVNRLVSEKYSVHLSIMGHGPLERELKAYIEANHLENHVTMLGHRKNPYKYVKNSDLFICASHAEGFSTAATEALIVGTPVCTVEVSGMKEMLGENNEYGIITDNSEEALYEGIKQLLDDPTLLQHYAQQAGLRGKDFSTEETVQAVQEMLISL